LPQLKKVNEELTRRKCERSLAEFAKQAWHILEPGTELKWGWALDAICDHLEAVTNGQVLNLLMNVPPGMMKSLLTGVIWPAWEWGPRGMPTLRILGTSHKQDLAIRDNLKCRRLIQSVWYQKHWPVKLETDQNAKSKFENSDTGFREAMAFTSMTGSRGDRVILDDPLSVDDANSEAALLSAERTFTEALPTRLNNHRSAKIVIMQRLHERDTSGIILSRNLDYVHLMLPMEFEPERKCYTRIGFEDPRTDDGDLLFPERFGREQVNDLKDTMGPYAVAGQMQQRPAPREGGMFKRDWFLYTEAIPHDVQWVRGWDLAASTSQRAAFTCGVKLGRILSTGKFIVGDVRRGKWTPSGVEKIITTAANNDGYACSIDLPQDPGQAGKSQVQYLVGKLAGYNVKASPESGSKVTRAEPLAAQAEVGNLILLKAPWNEKFVEEFCVFPGGDFMDQVDATSRAFARLLSARVGGTKRIRGLY
jgi:predicted phage terminase large subunit-like protein